MERPANYPKLENYTPTRFMLPTSHYDKERHDDIQNAKRILAAAAAGFYRSNLSEDHEPDRRAIRPDSGSEEPDHCR